MGLFPLYIRAIKEKLNQNDIVLMKFYVILFLTIFLLGTNSVMARPLSYPGGVMGMAENNSKENAFELGYTLTPHTAIAYRGAYQRDDESQNHAVQVNNLLWRGNFPDSQANIYSKLGGGANIKDGDIRGLFYGGIMAIGKIVAFMLPTEMNMKLSREMIKNSPKRPEWVSRPILAKREICTHG
jgi:hypothetical protein